MADLWNYQREESGFTEIPEGRHRVRIRKVEKAQSKAGNNMLVIELDVSGQTARNALRHLRKGRKNSSYPRKRRSNCRGASGAPRKHDKSQRADYVRLQQLLHLLRCVI